MVFRYAKIRLLRQLHSKSFTIIKAVQEDRKEITRLVQDVFYKTDPSSIYSKVANNPEISPTLLEMTVESLQENISFVAKENETDTKVIGVAINGLRPVVLKSDYMESLINQLKSKSEKTLLELWKFVSMMPPESAKLFEGEKTLFEIRFLMVDPDYRNMGIAKCLVSASMREAERKNHKLVRVDCTSHFTARIALRAGMACVYELNYADYKNPSGEQVFTDVNFPHTKVHVYVTRKFE